MADEKYIAQLTSRESALLLCLCAVTGIVFGVLVYRSGGFSEDSFSHESANARLILAVYLLSLPLGPGTWFGFLCRFGPRGAERRLLMRRHWWMFNVLAWGIGIIVFSLLYGYELVRHSA